MDDSTGISDSLRMTPSAGLLSGASVNSSSTTTLDSGVTYTVSFTATNGLITMGHITVTLPDQITGSAIGPACSLQGKPIACSYEAANRTYTF